MNGFLVDLRRQIAELAHEYIHTTSLSKRWYKGFPSFMKNLNDVIEEWGINCLYDVLLLEEIYSIFVELYDELRLRPDFKKISSEQVENTISLFSSILADEDIKKATALREFAIDNYDKYNQELLCESQKFKSSRRAEINKDIWEQMLQEEENFLENISDVTKVDADLKKAILAMSRANKLCINTTDEKDSFLDYLDSDNYITAFHYSLRLNILLSETFPDTLKPQFEAWLKGEDYKNPEPAQAKEEEKAEDKAEVKKKGGRTPESLFKDAEQTEEMKNRFLEYIQSELKITLDDLKKLEFDSKSHSELNIAIVNWLKLLKSENILDKTTVIPQRPAYRFLYECFKSCGVSINVTEKTYSNKLGKWLQ